MLPSHDILSSCLYKSSSHRRTLAILLSLLNSQSFRVPHTGLLAYAPIHSIRFIPQQKWPSPPAILVLSILTILNLQASTPVTRVSEKISLVFLSRLI
jgi:hypothetical protein